MDLATPSNAKLVADLTQPPNPLLPPILCQGLASQLGGAMALPIPPWGHILVLKTVLFLAILSAILLLKMAWAVP